MRKAGPRVVYVAVPGARRGLNSLSTKKLRGGARAETLLATLGQGLLKKECYVSLQSQEGAPELEAGPLPDLLGRPDRLSAPWMHVMNTGCSFGQVLGPRPQDPLSSGPVKKCRHWVANFP